jgi:hypothetical protein
VGRQCGIKLLRPPFVGNDESPDLIRGYAEVTQHLPERLTGVNRIEKLLP